VGNLPRTLDSVLAHHLAAHRQMAFVSGPRQVGKTTACRSVPKPSAYLSWDDQDDRRLITKGPATVVSTLQPHTLRERPVTVVFDELHKYTRWKTFLKGLYDKHVAEMHIVVTGSSRLDVYKRGGDSLMGRYLLYRMHPLSVGELDCQDLPETELRAPKKPNTERYDRLLRHGGFPEPFVKGDVRFSRRWRQLREQQLVREDVRDLTQIVELARLELLVTLLREGSGSQLSYSALAQEINVSVDTLRRWLATLCALHHGFLVRPWFRNVAKSLRKEPKWYLRDWSGIADDGRRAETLVACHLLKAVETWEDLGFGRFALHYLRDKQKREVDFVVVRDGKPWFVVEVKRSDTKLAPALAYYQQAIKAEHAFQVVLDLPYVNANCFEKSKPTVVPASTLLSQLP
jgi:predicted AAA+ superfamily ATPase